jgi:hypothetical protein
MVSSTRREEQTSHTHWHHRTKKAMGGAVTFQESFAARLDIIKPTTTQVLPFVRMIY